MLNLDWSPKGQHCYVTGGSARLGLELAKLLTKAGAHVSIVARDKKRLQRALHELQALRVDDFQMIQTYSFNLSTESGSKAAITAASKPFGGRCPDAIFLCAGAYMPVYTPGMSDDDLVAAADYAYWVQAWSATAGGRKMVEQSRKGRIVFVGSTLSHMKLPTGSVIYAPPKHAVVGLAETLHANLLANHIKVHIYLASSHLNAQHLRQQVYIPDLATRSLQSEERIPPEFAAADLLFSVKTADARIAAIGHDTAIFSATRGLTPWGAISIRMYVETILPATYRPIGWACIFLVFSFFLPGMQLPFLNAPTWWTVGCACLVYVCRPAILRAISYVLYAVLYLFLHE